MCHRILSVQHDIEEVIDIRFRVFDTICDNVVTKFVHIIYIVPVFLICEVS